MCSKTSINSFKNRKIIINTTIIVSWTVNKIIRLLLKIIKQVLHGENSKNEPKTCQLLNKTKVINLQGLILHWFFNNCPTNLPLLVNIS